jgi:predicted transposase/invertase (TIGR01784 family)
VIWFINSTTFVFLSNHSKLYRLYCLQQLLPTRNAEEPKNSHEHDLQDFSFTFIELSKFNKTNISELNTILEKWCFFFKYAAKTSEADLEKLIGSDLVIKQAYDALSQFNWSEPELIAYDEEIKRIRDNIAALDYQYDKGIEKGINQRNIEIVSRMLKENTDIKFISSVTGLSNDEILKIQNKL